MTETDFWKQNGENNPKKKITKIYYLKNAKAESVVHPSNAFSY